MRQTEPTEAQKIVIRRAEIELREPIDPNRDPLPPGHPVTWGAIMSGTVLKGNPYPLPVFA